MKKTKLGEYQTINGLYAPSTNYSQVVDMTHDEKVKMYMKIPKKDIIEMLISANNILHMLPAMVDSYYATDGNPGEIPAIKNYVPPIIEKEPDKPYWHKVPQEEINQLLSTDCTISHILENYQQPDWCGYPDALSFSVGCWSLCDTEKDGSRTKISPEYCKDCDCRHVILKTKKLKW